MAYSSPLLSGSTNGRGIAVAATATPGTLIHTALSGTAGIDFITLYATNVTSSAVNLTIEWGGTSTSDHLLDTYSIPANSTNLQIAFQIPLQNALVVRAFASSANAINIFGSVIRSV